jgi:hypothetical protein
MMTHVRQAIALQWRSTWETVWAGNHLLADPDLLQVTSLGLRATDTGGCT